MATTQANVLSSSPSLVGPAPFSSTVIVILGVLFWFSPAPEGLAINAWHLFDIFLCLIIGLILKPLPMGSLAIIALTAATLTHTLTLSQALSSYNSKVVWLVIIAFLLARGFIKTGLGARMAYHFIVLFGKNIIGLSYGLIASEILLSPLVPSNTARGAGVVFPIASSIAQELEGPSSPQKNDRQISAYLFQVCFQANVITSSLFMTAMAANPLISSLASKMGIEITWLLWAKAAFLPINPAIK